MHFNIRTAGEADFEAIFSLVQELALFQKAAEKVTNSVEAMKRDQAYFRCFVAENEEKEIVGMVSWFFAYYTWVGKSLYLDDLYVKEAFRGRQVGTELLKKIFEVADREQCQRVRWQVSHWNEPAIGFYKKLGADLDDECANCDFDVTAIQRLIS
jgi:ribosomal protein S18 acetylase RimI-like enzyme